MDEATDVNWSKCPRCRARMKETGTDNPRVLQEWFMGKTAAFVHDNGRTSVAWADHLELGIPAGQIVRGWHAGESEYAVRHGFRTIQGNHEWTYFCYPQGPGEPKPDWMPILDLQTVYRFDPASAGETAEQKTLVLGSQAHFWEESNVFVKTFPRLLASAEVVWTPRDQRDYSSFLQLSCHPERDGNRILPRAGTQCQFGPVSHLDGLREAGEKGDKIEPTSAEQAARQLGDEDQHGDS